MSDYFGGIELGGTKTICLIGQSAQQIIEQINFPTTTPSETINTCIEFFSRFQKIQKTKLAKLGIGSFGPIDVNPSSSSYGMFESTPKAKWSGVDLVGPIFNALAVPIILDSDVNAAALGEHILGAGKDLNNFIYLTVGTGLGGGAWLENSLVKGLSHPEMGHIALPRHKDDHDFESACPFHSDCVEGLASGTAISKRWGKPLNEFSSDHLSWDIEAHYLARLCHTLIHVYSCEKIIIGGGVSSETLLQKVRKELHTLLNNYVKKLESKDALDDFITLPQLAGQAGPLGAFLLTQDL